MKGQNGAMFSVGAIASILSPKLLCEFDELKDLLSYMVGEDLFTHSTIRAADACEPYLKDLYPELASEDLSDCNPENWKDYVKKLQDKYGLMLNVYPIAREDFESIDPYDEAVDMFGKEKVIRVDVDGESNDSP